MFSYFTVVYGLKQNERFHESSEISDLLLRRNCIIHQHSSEKGKSCGYPGVHFHGLFEYLTSIDYNDRIFKQIKMCCSYFITEDLNPFDYFLLVKKYNMECVVVRICDPTYLHKHRKKYEALRRKNTSPNAFDNISIPCSFKLPKATHDSILDLCKAFNSSSVDNYLTPSDSAAFVENWCIAQNIVPEEFVNNWIYCLNIEPQFKNTLFFQGVNNSCPQAILNSVIDACQPFVGEVSNGTTGYNFFWKDCLGKRMIALQEPYFDGVNSTDRMLEILEGTDSIIPVDDKTYVTMQRTPVIIIAKEFPNNRKLQFEIQNRLVKCYSNLKSFQPPPKKLHPMWLCHMAAVYYVPWWVKNICKRLPAASNIIINSSTVQPGTSAGANIVENATIQPGTSAVANIVENTAVQPGPSAGANIVENSIIQPGTSAGANIVENTAVQPGPSAGANIVENTTVQPGTSAGANIRANATVQPRPSARANIVENTTVQPGTSAETNIRANATVQPEPSAAANIVENTTVQPGPSAGTNIRANTTVQPGPSAGTNIRANTTVQPGTSAGAQIQDILREYARITALESQKESGNTSDSNCSELSEYNSESDFMDTEKAPVNLVLDRPKAKKSVQNERENEVQQYEENDLSSFPMIQPLGISNTKKRKSESGHQDQYKEEKRKKPFPNLSSFTKRAPAHSSDTSNTKMGKGKQTKGVACKNKTAFAPVNGLFCKAPPPVSDGFGTALAFQSEGINNRKGNSNVAVNKKKENKGKIEENKHCQVTNKSVSEFTHQALTSARAHQERMAGPSITPGLGTHAPGPSTKSGVQTGRKPLNAARPSVKDKITVEWQGSPQPPKMKPRCTFKNLRRNQLD